MPRNVDISPSHRDTNQGTHLALLDRVREVARRRPGGGVDQLVSCRTDRPAVRPHLVAPHPVDGPPTAGACRPGGHDTSFTSPNSKSSSHTAPSTTPRLNSPSRHTAPVPSNRHAVSACERKTAQARKRPASARPVGQSRHACPPPGTTYWFAAQRSAAISSMPFHERRKTS
eukprot:1936667-Rhodomonas_salina.1